MCFNYLINNIGSNSACELIYQNNLYLQVLKKLIALMRYDLNLIRLFM